MPVCWSSLIVSGGSAIWPFTMTPGLFLTMMPNKRLNRDYLNVIRADVTVACYRNSEFNWTEYRIGGYLRSDVSKGVELL